MSVPPSTTDVALSLGGIRRGLVAIPLVFLALSLPIEWLATTGGWVSHATDLFRLSGEGTIPTWYSSVLLLACGVALLVVGHQRGAVPNGRAVDWTLLGGIFVYMSMDEAVQIHELMNGSGPGTTLYFGWVIPAAVIVLLLGARYVPFLLAQPPRLRARIVVAGAIYVGAALVMEIPLGLVAEQSGQHSLGYRLLDTGEELFEIVGLTVFLLALLGEVAAIRPRLVLSDESPPRRG